MTSPVTLDGNHPLCGREVLFKLEVLSVRDATRKRSMRVVPSAKKGRTLINHGWFRYEPNAVPDVFPS